MMLTRTSHSDIASFYKEELAGETENHVSVLAGVHGTTRLEALSHIVDDTVVAHERIQHILEGNGDEVAKRTLDAYLAFSRGYIGFHAGAMRYKLKELGL